jgi:hypothetical protein
MSSDDDVSPGDSSSDDEQSDEFEEEEMEEEEEEEGFFADDARSQVTFDDENITPGGLNPFSVMLPPQAERLFRKDLPKPVNADRIKKSNYKASMKRNHRGRRKDKSRGRGRRCKSRSQRDGGEEGHVQFYAPPLPSTDARLQQYEAYGVSFSNNASVVVDPNMNSENFDAAGALLRMNGSFGNY